MFSRYTALAFVGIVLVLAAFGVDKSEFTGEAVAVLMGIIGMSMLIVSIVFGWKSSVSTSEQGDREDT